MKITKEVVDLLEPEHSRTSCSDTNINNGFYRISEEKIRDVVVKREWEIAPRCNRCFLLQLVGEEIDPAIQISIDIDLKQPQFKITQI